MNYKYIREWSKERIKEFKVKCDGPEALGQDPVRR